MKYPKHRLISFFLICLCILPHLTLATMAQRLPQCPDVGRSYVDQMVFFGESTTAHLTRKGGVFDNDNDRNRVLRDESGTRMLSRRTLLSSVVLVDNKGERRTVSFLDAIKELKPRILVLSFGLNGLNGFLQDPSHFADSYRVLINGILAASPETRILLQSVYPVASAVGCDCDVDTRNARIRTLNGQIEALSDEWEEVRYVDTASVLRDGAGRLSPQYDVGDGIHLTNDAYLAVFSYLRTHAWR